MDTGVDLGTLIGIMGGTFALTTTIIGILVRQLLVSSKSRSDEQIKSVQTEYNEKLASLKRLVEDSVNDRSQCELRETRKSERVEGLVEKLRDQWLEFQKSDAAMEATRGRRLDAMFGVLDHQKDELRGIKPAVLQRQEELHKQAVEELRRDLRIYVREVLKAEGPHA